MRAAPALLLLLAGCATHETDDDQPRLLDATIIFPPRDTVRFSLPAATYRCTDPHTLLIEAVSPEGNGVLVRIHYPDSLASRAYRVVPPGDTAIGAAVAVRYLLRETARGFSFDTGTVQVGRTGGGGAARSAGTFKARGPRTQFGLPPSSIITTSCCRRRRTAACRARSSREHRSRRPGGIHRVGIRPAGSAAGARSRARHHRDGHR